MPHNLTQNGRYFVLDSARGPAWRKLGTLTHLRQTTVEAVRMVGIDAHHVDKLPTFTVVAQGTPQQKVLRVPDQVALVRRPLGDDPDHRLLGTASEDYAIMQRLRLAEILEPLSREWPVESVGLLGQHGETIFFALQAGVTDVAGDEIKDFFVLSDTQLPGTALRMMHTPVRTVCQNTYDAGVRAASLSFRIPHLSASFEQQTTLIVEMMARMRGVMLTSSQVFGKMAETPVTADETTKVVTYAYPDPPVPLKARVRLQLETAFGPGIGDLDDATREAMRRYDAGMARAETNRTQVAQLVERFNDEYPRAARTTWAVYNGVVEFADHRVGFRERESTRERGRSALFGSRADEKARAFTALTEPSLGLVAALS